MSATREQRLEQALFRGGALTFANAAYLQAVCALTETLLQSDLASGDLTAKALGLNDRNTSASVIARQGGVAAGLEEFALLLRGRGVDVVLEKNDGDVVRPGETLLQAEGKESELLGLERVGLNLLQRMSGIATTARCLQERVRQRNSATRIVGTRKTPWGLLDKRALHLGGVGTHRLGLGDAILIKNNHLARLAAREEDAVPLAIEKAWKFRAESEFIEIEVRGEAAARAAARAFRRLQEVASEQYPCLLMLDNMTPAEIGAILEMLHRENLWDHALIEASGGISESNVEGYAACGVDAVSIGALTHSARALDLCQRIS
ncbi:MAG TPA: carboxylating nicotinate-nucleotide diphosphorylase [Candidatus Acidoferrales bacterium]|nr:carboxylating nicotinate-nucleotide diphosphorylase [Candidatus Acidoferrales bacterium]